MPEIEFIFEQSCLDDPPTSNEVVAWEPSEADWKKYKDEILELFRHNTVKKVMEIMKQRYGFTSTEDVYKRHIHRLWGSARKYNEASHMFIMAYVWRERNRRGWNTRFKYHDRLIGEAELKRFFGRRKMSIIQAAEKARTFPPLRQTLMPLRVAPPDKQLHLEWLIWNASKFGSRAPLSPFDEIKLSNGEALIYQSNSSLRRLVKKSLGLMDKSSQLAFLVFAPSLIEVMRKAVCFSEGVLFVFVECLMVPPDIAAGHLKALCTGLAGFLIEEVSGINPSLAELMRGLPGYEPHDILKVVTAHTEARTAAELKSTRACTSPTASRDYQKNQRGWVEPNDSALSHGRHEVVASTFHSFTEMFKVATRENDYKLVNRVASNLLTSHSLENLELVQMTYLLDCLLFSPAWPMEQYPLMFLTEICTRRYLYQIHKEIFRANDPQALRHEQQIRNTGFTCVGNISLSDSTHWRRGLGALWCSTIGIEDKGVDNGSLKFTALACMEEVFEYIAPNNLMDFEAFVSIKNVLKGMRSNGLIELAYDFVMAFIPKAVMTVP